MVEVNCGKKMNVAVIGAGGAGLVTLCEFLELGHKVTVYESESAIGGTWNYESSTRTSMYKSLRTNIPREIMALERFKLRPKDDPENGSFTGDARQFPCQEEI